MQVSLPGVETRAWFEVCGDEANGAARDASGDADADLRTVCVYRPGMPVEELQGLDHIVGEGCVDGFRLELKVIREGV
jgi:hypothetical protein